VITQNETHSSNATVASGICVFTLAAYYQTVQFSLSIHRGSITDKFARCPHTTAVTRAPGTKGIDSGIIALCHSLVPSHIVPVVFLITPAELRAVTVPACTLFLDRGAAVERRRSRAGYEGFLITAEGKQETRCGYILPRLRSSPPRAFCFEPPPCRSLS
jgi:hypothetical protein